MATPGITKEDLISFAKPYFKARGFTKKGNRWSKVVDGFTLVFFIQGSQWDKHDYYIRPGVFMDGIAPETCRVYYGHFFTEISPSSMEQIFRDLDVFFREWTDKPLIKKRVVAFVEWKKHSRPADHADASALQENPPPRILFAAPQAVLDHVIAHY